MKVFFLKCFQYSFFLKEFEGVKLKIEDGSIFIEEKGLCGGWVFFFFKKN